MTIITFTEYFFTLSHLIQDSHEISITASILQMRKPRQESQASVPVTEEEIKSSSMLNCILFHFTVKLLVLKQIIFSVFNLWCI